MTKGEKFHFVGVGGIGMSGIAEVLLSLGYEVSGSDIVPSAITERLASLGAKIFIGHDGDNIAGATSVIFSSAISVENPELLEARSKNIPIMRRARMLAKLMHLKKGVAVAGTHGKTTTTSILATMLKENDFDPTYIIGGVVHNLAGHANVGKGDYLIAEADESDASFLLLNPVMAIVTNVDFDHMDFYDSKEGLKDAFVNFVNNMQSGGRCSINVHDQNLKEMAKRFQVPCVYFGIRDERKSDQMDYSAANIAHRGMGMAFDLFHQSEKVCDIYLPVPGRHNVLNALGAISIAHLMGVGFEGIKSSIASFSGVDRRVQVLFKCGEFEIIDDYAHHPTEVAVTLETVRAINPQKRIVVIFEPHRFTRTKYCWDDFYACFSGCDKVYICPIYAASESEIPGINSENLSRDINKKCLGLTEPLADIGDIFDIMEACKNDEVILLTLGAGSIGKKVREWVGRHV